MRNVPPLAVLEQSALLTARQAAEWLGLTEPTLRRWRCEGRGPRFVKLNGAAVRYTLSELEAYVGHAHNSTTAARAYALSR